jgi:hypothetical protein
MFRQFLPNFRKVRGPKRRMLTRDTRVQWLRVGLAAANGAMCSQRRHCIALFVLAFGPHGCNSKHRRTEPEGNSDVQVPVPANAQAGDGASPDAGKDCEARKSIKRGSPMHPPLGQIIPGDGIQSDWDDLHVSARMHAKLGLHA